MNRVFLICDPVMRLITESHHAHRPARVCAGAGTLSFPTNPFSDNSLPTTPPGLGGIGDRTSFQINFEGGVGSTVRGNISSLTLVANPLPPAVILFGAGLVALVGLGAGSWRQRKNGLA